MDDLTEQDGSQSQASWSRILLKMQERLGQARGDVQRVMDIVAASAVEIMPHADGAVVCVREGDTLVLRSGSGTAVGTCGIHIPVEHTVSGQALIEGRSLLCNDGEYDPPTAATARRQICVRSTMAVPVPRRGEHSGVLTLYSRQPRAFTAQDLLTAELLAGPLAIAFATATEELAPGALSDGGRRFVLTVEQAAVGLAHIRPDGRFAMVNAKSCEIAGYTREQLLDTQFQDITYADDLDIELGYAKGLIDGVIPYYTLEKRLVRADGRTVWIMLSVSLVRDSEGRPDFFVAVVDDIHGRKQAELNSLHDPLTGLLNARGAAVRLERELGRWARPGQAITVGFLDIDGFKALNASHGQAEGNQCLIDVGQALDDACRPGDLVARLGGDEFLVLLPELTFASAPRVLQRLLDAVKGACPHVSGSMGAVTLEGGVGAPEEVVAAAGKLMHRAKHEGCDRFVLERWQSHQGGAAGQGLGGG